jgi:hypothetical protein
MVCSHSCQKEKIAAYFTALSCLVSGFGFRENVSSEFDRTPQAVIACLVFSWRAYAPVAVVLWFAGCFRLAGFFRMREG